MTFKDCLMDDIDSTFMNVDEFSDKHTIEIDGMYLEDIPVQVDESEVIEREKKVRSYMDGIHVRQLVIYVRAADLQRPPAVDRLLTLDGEVFIVTDVVDELGIYSITLEQNRSQQGW